jgi:hypothetical protein
LLLSRGPVSQEVRAVTLQIGLVGIDGNIVLASDRRMTEDDGQWRQSHEATKLLISTNRKFAVAFAGSDLAERVAHDAIASDENLPWPDVIEHAIKHHCNKNDGGAAKASILSIGNGDLCHFRFDLRGVERRESGLGRAISGDHGNPAAIFFIDRYYGRRYVNDLKVYALKRLAAHAVLMGGKINTCYVEGLDIVVWDQQVGEIISIARPEIEELSRWSESLDRKTEQAILTGSSTS